MPFSPEEFEKVRGHSCDTELNYILLAASSIFEPVNLREHAPRFETLDPVRLFELARLNKMLNFLPANVADLPRVCAALAPAINEMRLRTLALNRRGLLAGAEISTALNKAGIAHLHFKGPLQQVALYGTYLQKPSSDVDILVPRSQRSHAAQCVVDAGYVQLDSAHAIWWAHFLDEMHFINHKTGVVIDLHHGVQQPGLPRPLDLPGLFDRRSEMIYEDLAFETPCPVDRSLLAAISISKAMLSHEPALSLIVDLRATLTQLREADLADLLIAARNNGLEQTLGLAVRALDATFPDFDRPDLPLPMPLSEIEGPTLRPMIATPWLDALPWPRRRRLLRELCGNAPLRFIQESTRSLMSEVLRKSLEYRTARKRATL
ncbi:nucleotidyltransferase family protein [Thioclava indica]|uniref:Nucleotidyltransferase family protein n=1 Tax=Thioclava indica TaxID=1353528 RepID=A0A074JVF7_9RHOB|nr:nucleotidyltransferase family protein [Thioclava indica]KEO59890.1 hypothetical protein DT23_15615 [Thioclava indica]